MNHNEEASRILGKRVVLVMAKLTDEDKAIANECFHRPVCTRCSAHRGGTCLVYQGRGGQAPCNKGGAPVHFRDYDSLTETERIELIVARLSSLPPKK